MLKTTSDAEIDAAIKRGKRFPKSVDAIAAAYLPAPDQVAVSFENGMEIRFPRLQLDGLENANNADALNEPVPAGADANRWLMLFYACYSDDTKRKYGKRDSSITPRVLEPCCSLQTRLWALSWGKKLVRIAA